MTDIRYMVRAFISEGEVRDLRNRISALERPWQPISTAPDYTLVEVCGDSGMSTHRHFLALAFRSPEYRGNAWLDVNNDRLSEQGWEPTHWRPASSFPPL